MLRNWISLTSILWLMFGGCGGDDGTAVETRATEPQRISPAHPEHRDVDREGAGDAPPAMNTCHGPRFTCEELLAVPMDENGVPTEVRFHTDPIVLVVPASELRRAAGWVCGGRLLVIGNLPGADERGAVDVCGRVLWNDGLRWRDDVDDVGGPPLILLP